ncbi:hypothetical protein HPP92_009926 [Vanilla planifolia]|uniref:Uncharacterized protein n=1 Tax=Vanilla planifolia TaxID=51239 RepID=A0A835RH47_VANPL|nr:hypothetical protein HPP92_009926 [Vanilla planifolia]
MKPGHPLLPAQKAAARNPALVVNLAPQNLSGTNASASSHNSGSSRSPTRSRRFGFNRDVVTFDGHGLHGFSGHQNRNRWVET